MVNSLNGRILDCRMLLVNRSRFMMISVDKPAAVKEHVVGMDGIFL